MTLNCGTLKLSILCCFLQKKQETEKLDVIVPEIQPSASCTGSQTGSKGSDAGPDFNDSGNPFKTVGNRRIFSASQTHLNAQCLPVMVNCQTSFTFTLPLTQTVEYC